LPAFPHSKPTRRPLHRLEGSTCQPLYLYNGTWFMESALTLTACSAHSKVSRGRPGLAPWVAGC